MKSYLLFLRLCLLTIVIGIILGAFGAHALKDLFSDYEEDIWNKGIFYQITNALGLLLLIILAKINLLKSPSIVFYLITLGIIFFSGSLYVIALTNIFLSPEHIIKTILIPITPLGGTLLIVGWSYAIFKITK
jgi:uncharacterized membrane protein YgdD (TMEM256/DUF423 family)